MHMQSIYKGVYPDANLVFKMQVPYCVLLLFSCYYYSLVESKNICIIRNENICVNYTCDANITIEDLPKHTENISEYESTNIILCSTKILLQRLISIQNRSSFSITSYANSSRIICKKFDGGLKFLNITKVTLKNFEIEKCGTEYESAFQTTMAKHIFKSSVYFLRSSDISIVNVNITKSDGIGLTVVDCNGSVLIENSTFEKNIFTEALRGGGLYIEFSYCSYGVLTAGICGNTSVQNSNYTIKRCTFKENIASRINSEPTTR